jgi:hypothetical protein
LIALVHHVLAGNGGQNIEWRVDRHARVTQHLHKHQRSYGTSSEFITASQIVR